MSDHYSDLINCFVAAADGVKSFIKGEILPFGDKTYVKKDPIWERLVKEDVFDNTVETYLGVLLPAMCVLSQRLFKDHIQGGKYYKCRDSGVRSRTVSVPKTSKFAESIFGSLDQLMR